MSDEPTHDENAQRFAGRVILVGLVCLMLAMAFGVVALALMSRPGGGDTFMALAKICGVAWLPIVGMGIFMRLTNTKPESNSSNAGDK